MKYKLKDIFDLQMEKTPSRDNQDYWSEGNNKWISIADLSKTGKYIYETKETLSDIAIKECLGNSPKYWNADEPAEGADLLGEYPSGVYILCGCSGCG